MQIFNTEMPNYVDLEQSILSSIFLYPETIEEVIDSLNMEDFYKSAHQCIFNVIQDLHSKNLKIEISILINVLKEKRQLEVIGGYSFLAGLLDVPIATNLDYCIKKIKSASILRKLITESYQIIKQSFENKNADEVLENAQKLITKIDFNKNYEIQNIKDIALERQEYYEKINQNKSNTTGISTGFKTLDNFTSGFQNSDLIILAARPSIGKTALALNMAANMAKHGKKVLFYSLEMSKEQLFDRIMAFESGVNSMKFRSGQFDVCNWENINFAQSKISEWGLFIDDSAGLHYSDIIKRTRKMKKRHDIEIVFIDYLQLILGDKNHGRNEEISSISRNLKLCAKDNNLPVICLSQLNRELEKRSDKRPILSDLRDSGAIEQDADVVLMLYRDEVYNKNTPDLNKAELNISKQRTGPVGNMFLHWNSKTTKFSDLII